jgi:hypothetical protein
MYLSFHGLCVHVFGSYDECIQVRYLYCIPNYQLDTYIYIYIYIYIYACICTYIYTYTYAQQRTAGAVPELHCVDKCVVHP